MGTRGRAEVGFRGSIVTTAEHPSVLGSTKFSIPRRRFDQSFGQNSRGKPSEIPASLQNPSGYLPVLASCSRYSETTANRYDSSTSLAPICRDSCRMTLSESVSGML